MLAEALRTSRQSPVGPAVVSIPAPALVGPELDQCITEMVRSEISDVWDMVARVLQALTAQRNAAKIEAAANRGAVNEGQGATKAAGASDGSV